MISHKSTFGRRALLLLAAAAVSCLYTFPRLADARTAAPGDEAKPAALPTETEQLPGTLVKWDMIQVPAGSIEMPDPEKPGEKKRVEVKKLWMSKTEVTWDLYDIYAFRMDLTEDQKAKGVDAESRPSKPYGAPDRGFGHAGYPAINLNIGAAEFFCKWLSAKTGKKYRVPTEAEWEYACRAGQTAGEPLTKEQLEPIAWYWDNADDKTHGVGEKKPNAWGFLDMLGNAAEWVTTLDKKSALAGGSFLDKYKLVQPNARAFYKPEWQAEDAHTPKSKWWLSNGPFAGLRVVREE